MSGVTITSPFASSYPTDPPSSLVAGVNYAHLDGPGNFVDLAVKASSGSGTVFLLCWEAEAGAWLPWGSVAVSSTTSGGWARALVRVEDAVGDWTVFVSGTVSIATVRLWPRTLR